MSKVKVFTLAKKFGYKSAEFVDVLKNIGFPVSSYQASIEEWDVPIIEQRLQRAGLIGGPKADGAADAKKKEAEDGDETAAPSWDDLMKTAARESGDAKPAAPTPTPTVEAPKPETGARVLRPAPSAPSPTPVAPKPAPTPRPAATPKPPAPSAKPAAPAPQVAEPRAKPAAASVAPAAPASAAPTSSSAPATDESAGEVSSTPGGPPTPKPRVATRVGRIDLAALGLIRSQQEQHKKTATFTDLREKESTRRRDLRQKQRERQRDRRQGRVGPKGVSTIDRIHDVVLELPVTVKSFSGALGIPVSEILQRMMDLGVMSNINAALDTETIELLAEEFEIGIQIKEETDLEKELLAEIQAARHAVDDSTLQPRPPVITFLGHVDHGKTTLVDAIRSTRVAAKESGGITQHVGAYVAELPSKQTVTILDTPGHEAFTAMRQRGARATDIAVLVVAADDGVMPQTEEAAAHARAAGVPVVVAINKVDAVGANIQQVKTQLSNIGLQPEEWGGSTGVVEVSGLRKTGMDKLLERVLLEAELLGLKGHAKGDAVGVVLEASLEKGKGKVATVLVQDGTLRSKDIVLAGTTFGKIRLMFDHAGKPLKEAGPSVPVQILGLEELPPIGEKFFVVADLQAAKNVAEKRAMLKTEKDRREKAAGVTAANLFDKLDESQSKRLRYLIKADALGSLEVLKKSVEELGNEEVIVDVVHAGVGGVTETDVLLAETANAVILAFHVVPEGKARKEAERVRVEIRRYEVIYELLESVGKEAAGLLTPQTREDVIGSAEVLQIFRSSRWGVIAGCRVTQGTLKRSCRARVVRDGRKVYEAPFASLRHLKDDVREVEAPKECGLKVQDFEDLKVGDVIEAIETSNVAAGSEGSEREA